MSNELENSVFLTIDRPNEKTGTGMGIWKWTGREFPWEYSLFPLAGKFPEPPKPGNENGIPENFRGNSLPAGLNFWPSRRALDSAFGNPFRPSPNLDGIRIGKLFRRNIACLLFPQHCLHFWDQAKKVVEFGWIFSEMRKYREFFLQ
jgi:hypothetical protein